MLLGQRTWLSIPHAVPATVWSGAMHAACTSPALLRLWQQEGSTRHSVRHCQQSTRQTAETARFEGKVTCLCNSSCRFSSSSVRACHVVQVTGITQLSNGKAQHFGSAGNSIEERHEAEPSTSVTNKNITDVLKGASYLCPLSTAQ